MKPKLYVLTLQPLKERYTGLWYVWFKRELSKYFDVEYIDGVPIERRLENAPFLPVNGAYNWELTQLLKFLDLIRWSKIKDGSYVLSMDIEFPGHSWAVKHLLEMNGYDVKVFGWLHAGSYTKGDFTERFESWQKWMELGWLSIFDGVFVASNYHKRAIIERRIKPVTTPLTGPELMRIEDKIHPVGNPFYVKDAWVIAGIKEPKAFEDRTYDVIITDRPDLEKNITLALAIALASDAKKIAVCTGRRTWSGWNFKNIRKFVEKLNVDVYEDVSRSQYYQLLNDSKVWLTASPEENFGYCAVEAMAFNTQPVMPYCCAFIEHVDRDSRFLYVDLDDAVLKINRILKYGPIDDTVKYAKKYEYVLDKVAKIMLGCG